MEKGHRCTGTLLILNNPRCVLSDEHVAARGGDLFSQLNQLPT